MDKLILNISDFFFITDPLIKNYLILPCLVIVVAHDKIFALLITKDVSITTDFETKRKLSLLHILFFNQLENYVFQLSEMGH